MSKSGSTTSLVAALLVTVGLAGGGLWAANKLAPGLLPNVFGDTGGGSLLPQSKNQLTILGDTFSGYSTFRDSEFQAVLQESELSLKYEDEFDQAKRAERLSQGRADLIVTTLDQFLQQRPAGKIVALIDRTVGADAVVLNTKKYPSLKSLQDLGQLVAQQRSQGQQLSIAYAGDTPSEYLALVLDTKFEAFNLSDFNIVEVADASEAWDLLKDPNQSVAIAVIWEPFVTKARQQGYNVVLSSQDAPNAIVDVVVASNRLMQSNSQALSNFLSAYYRRIDANVRDTAQLKAQIAADGGLQPQDAAAVLQGIQFFTAVEAKNWMDSETLKQRINATSAVLVLSGRADKVPEAPEQLFTPQFLAPAASNTQTLIDLVKADNPDLAARLSGKSQGTPAPANVQASQIQAAPDIGNLQVRGEVKFGTGSAQLTSQGQQTLNNLVQEIGEFNPQTVAVRVIGHTSKTGSASLNQSLSQQRAQVVVNYLRQKGLKHSFLAEGKGFSLPLQGIPPQDSRNQRTEIRLVRVN